MCLMCFDAECSKTGCKDIKYKRYFLPLIFIPATAIFPEVFNFYYFPLVVGFSAFILFWNFPKIVYYTVSRPLYYEDLFIDVKKLPNYDVSNKLKNKFQFILEWVLIITNTFLVAGLSDWWLYKTVDHLNMIEIVGITGGIIKMFQLVNNTISRIMLKILRKIIKKENKEFRQKQSQKIKELVNFKLTDQKNMVSESDDLELIEQKQPLPKRGRISTI
uniref:Uncharacterized protein n=1 Tax=viral metagenome TaxID=1070528 RepID=A0A6C0JAM1_9ZZZZ